MTPRSGRWRTLWQTLLVAGAISYSQLQPGSETDVRAAERFPYVWVQPTKPVYFHETEVLGRHILTLPMDERRPYVFSDN